MRVLQLYAALAACCSVYAWSPQPRDYETRDYYALHLDGSTSPADIAEHLGMRHDGQVADLAGHHVFSAPKHTHDIVGQAKRELQAKRRKRDGFHVPHLLDGVLDDQKQARKKRLVKRTIPDAPPQRRNQLSSRKKQKEDSTEVRAAVARELSIEDPIFNDQWHLFNTVEAGHDLNISGVWSQGITGKNATVCIIDDGLDMDSDDLKDNYFAAGSWDFNDKVKDPKPRLDDDHHGTRCAGEVAAAKNDVCGVGVAWDARIAGIRILSDAITDIDEAEAVIYGYQENDIYSCSWGPPDDGQTMEAPGILIRKAMVQAVQQGRQGRGTIYVFAAGNGSPHQDNCNFDGYTNSIYSVTVGAIDREDNHPWYSESCSALMVVTYSSGSGESAISTTDVGVNKCTPHHGGTSAAGPLASGVYALLLQIRPDLTWRDIQWLSVLTSVKPDTKDGDWQTGPLGRPYSHKYGYGKLNAYNITERAKTWEVVKPQAWFYSPWFHVRHEIPQGEIGLASTFAVTEEMLKNANLERLEHVTVTMNIAHTRRGDISVGLLSPTGILSTLSTTRVEDDAATGYNDWTFMSVAHWGESGIGYWTIVVRDTEVNEHNGTFTDWKLRLWGEAIDGTKQPLLPLPDAHDDDDHDVDVPHHVTTTSVALPTPTKFTGNPSDRPQRPQHPGRPSSSSSSQSPASTTIPSSEAPSDEPPLPSAEPEQDKSNDQFLPSPFPTFGVSKKTQIWIYAAVALILVFVVSLGSYLFLMRRRRLRREGLLGRGRNPRDAYEFDMLPDHDEDGEERKRKAGGTRRAGELYDAFAGESDGDVFSEDDEDAERRERDKKIREAGGGGYRDEDGEGEEWAEKRR